MNNHTPNTVGIDISKAYLDAYELPSQRAARFANHASGFKRLAEWIGAPVQCVVYESTGPWHRALEEALADTYAGPRYRNDGPQGPPEGGGGDVSPRYLSY